MILHNYRVSLWELWICLTCMFEVLQKAEALEYIQRQMELSEASGRIFDENATLVAYGSYGESIRKLNPILTKSLMLGVQNHKQNIDADIALSAVNDIELC